MCKVAYVKHSIGPLLKQHFVQNLPNGHGIFLVKNLRRGKPQVEINNIQN